MLMAIININLLDIERDQAVEMTNCTSQINTSQNIST